MRKVFSLLGRHPQISKMSCSVKVYAHLIQSATFFRCNVRIRPVLKSLLARNSSGIHVVIHSLLGKISAVFVCLLVLLLSLYRQVMGNTF